MELFGTNFALSLGAWRLRFVLALEEVEDACHSEPVEGRHADDASFRPRRSSAAVHHLW